jgi:cephalosporin hydroxylase
VSDIPSATVDLRAAAIRLRAEVSQRVDATQGGVPTFFDGYVLRLIDHLISTEVVHGWLDVPDPTPGTDKGNLVFALRWTMNFITKMNHERFQTYAERRRTIRNPVCEVGQFDLLMSQGVVGCMEWRGRPLFKTVYDFSVLPMLLHEVRPRTVLEVGSGTGASALWMADLCRASEIPTQIHSVDIRQVPTPPDSATFHVGDAHRPESLFPPEILHSAPHPWVAIEDAHVNVAGVLRFLAPHLRAGDYLIVEDSRDKQEVLAQVIGDRYRVDSRYTDFFGRNATSAEDSIFKVIR